MSEPTHTRPYEPLRCEHGKTAREWCEDCALPAYDTACPVCGALAGFGCVGWRGPVLMHAERLVATKQNDHYQQVAE